MTSDPPGLSEGFDPEQYWSNRLSQNYSLHGVGWLGLGQSYNRWMYAVRRHVFRRVVRGRFDPAGARVLDVGSGTGVYVALWQKLGVRDITGSDLSVHAVTQLRTRFPGRQFVHIDISAESIELKGPFDAISAMDVLFHVVDDDGYARAIQNLAALLVPGGMLVLTENLLHGDAVKTEHQTSRSLEHVYTLLRQAGLEIELRRPLFVLMNSPIDSDSRLLKVTWAGARVLAPRGLGWLLGAFLFPIELVLTKILNEGPSTEIVVCRKPGHHRIT